MVAEWSETTCHYRVVARLSSSYKSPTFVSKYIPPLILFSCMLTLVFGTFVSEAMVNRSLDLGLIAKETTMFYGHKFLFAQD